jgi:hypothetical protein
MKHETRSGKRQKMQENARKCTKMQAHPRPRLHDRAADIIPTIESHSLLQRELGTANIAVVGGRDTDWSTAREILARA